MTSQGSNPERTPGGNPAPEARESIWSVPPGRMAQYFALFTLFATCGVGYLLWYEIFENTADTLPQTALAIIDGVAAATVGSAGLSLLIVEGPRFAMVMADYFTKKWLNPLKEQLREEGRAKGREEGRTEGREEGSAERDAEWSAWLERQTAAAAKGEPFNEPPPSANSHG